MKKKLSYRDQLLELAKIYSVKEVQDYIKNRKNLTSGQLELILRKNKIIIPKDFKTNFFKENVTKPLLKASRLIDDLKYDTSKSVNKVSRKISYMKEDSSRSISSFFYSLWRNIGTIGIGFLEVLPKLGSAILAFWGNLFTNLFHGIYEQQINKNKLIKTVFDISHEIPIRTNHSTKHTETVLPIIPLQDHWHLLEMHPQFSISRGWKEIVEATGQVLDS